MNAAPSLPIDLVPHDRLFQGLVPGMLATVSVDGIPNVVGVSHVYRVDAEHVAISEQFMRRTRENLEQTRKGEILLTDAVTGDQHLFVLQFVRRDTEGSIVEPIRAKVESIAAATGMAAVFAVRAALVCRVIGIRRVEVHAAPPAAGPRARAPGLTHIARMAELIGTATGLARLATVVLDEMEPAFGFSNAMLLLPDEAGERLFTFDSRGYATSGVGSEVAIGEGVIGHAASRLMPIRVSSLKREIRYARAALSVPAADEIPLPLLPSAESILAVPLALRGKLVGVLVVESLQELAFSPDDELALTIVARLLAPEIARARAESAEEPPTAPVPPAAPTTSSATLGVRYYEENDSIFVGGEYLVKGVAGRILWTVLGDFSEGRSAFSNRELRVDPRLGLQGYNDNLEARLLLLRRRLEEKAVPVRLAATGRGRFVVTCDRRLTLEKVPARPAKSS